MRYFISRHPGAQQWALTQGLGAVSVVAHLDPDQVCANDEVIGTLPVHLAAAVCERGATFFNLSLDIPAALRGRELSLEQLHACNARLERFQVQRAVPQGPAA